MKYLILISVILLACQSKEEKLRLEITETLKKHWHNMALKKNATLQLFELKVLKIDTVSKSALDTVAMARYRRQINLYSHLVQKQIGLLKAQQNTAKLYGETGSNRAKEATLSQVEEYLNKAQEYNDSLRYYNEQDSVLRARIAENNSPRNMYRAKVFVKATMTTNKGSENTLDSIYYFFDTNKKMIEL